MGMAIDFALELDQLGDRHHSTQLLGYIDSSWRPGIRVEVSESEAKLKW